ncbi:MAG: hypothetical protein IT385_14450 [Deltaproteobacteria bacterium]|nr:hypothetical protein [Deltaproteobacteria bacterium]
MRGLQPLAWIMVTVSIGVACGPEIASTGVTATSGGTSGDDGDGSEMSEGDRTAWLVVFVLLGVTTVGGLVAWTVSDEEMSYLDQHRQDIRVALARGDGPFVRDVAAGLRLPPELVPALGEALRAHRASIEPALAGEEVAPAGFARALDRAVRADPRLAPYSREILSRLQASGHVTPGAAVRYERALVLELATVAAP